MDIKSVLETIDNAMLMVKSAADTPGINLIPYVSTLSTVIGATHAAYVAGKNIAPYLENIRATYTGSGLPAQADLDALEARIKELDALVDAPLPPREEGEPE